MIQLIQYNERDLLEKEIPAGESIPVDTSPDMVNWLIADLNQPEEVVQVAELLQLSDLVLEDIYNQDHLPKFELLDNACLLILKRLRKETEDLFDHEHSSLILSGNVLLTFTPNPGNQVITKLQNRIRKSLGRVRKEKADYLFYRFIDLVVDEYLAWTENIREKIDLMDESADDEPGEERIREIRKLKRILGETRKNLVPLRDQIARIKTEGTQFVKKSTQVYLQDVYDHLGHVNMAFEHFREMLKDLTDLYLSLLGNSSNQVMKTLTIVASIFIPLTFVVGIYGMNFENMPELGWKWGYPAILLLMLVISGGMIVYMKRKKWF